MPVKKEKAKDVLNILLAALIPALPMLYFYTNNWRYIMLRHILLTALIFVCLSLALCLWMRKLLGSVLAAGLWCWCFWVALFSYGAVYDSALATKVPHWILLSIYAALLLGCLWGIRRVGKKYDFRILMSFLTVVWVVLTAFNGIRSIHIAWGYQHMEVDASKFKKDFVVKADLPSPNIYWIHCDGMLGFDAMETYFGESQAEFRQQLEQRGFVINTDAAFFSEHTTEIAIPILLSPDYYDRYLYPKLYKLAIQDYSDPIVLKELYSVRVHNEMTAAFEEKGYHTITLADLDIYYPPITDMVFSCIGERALLFKKTNLPQGNLDWMQEFRSKRQLLYLMRRTTMLAPLYGPLSEQLWDGIGKQYLAEETPKFFEDDPLLSKASDTKTMWTEFNYMAMADALEVSLQSDEPRLVFMHYFLPHSPFFFDQDGNMEIRGALDIMRYPGNHKFAAKVLIAFVDSILQADPEALIVLQSDHGLHLQSAKNILKAFPPEDPQSEKPVIDLWNGTLSAIRLPERYGAIEQPILPVNISRMLVNNFVGWNYNYLDGNDSDLY